MLASTGVYKFERVEHLAVSTWTIRKRQSLPSQLTVVRLLQAPRVGSSMVRMEKDRWRTPNEIEIESITAATRQSSY